MVERLACLSVCLGLLLAWQRSAEFSCDRAALLVAQVPTAHACLDRATPTGLRTPHACPSLPSRA